MLTPEEREQILKHFRFIPNNIGHYGTREQLAEILAEWEPDPPVGCDEDDDEYEEEE